MSQLTRRSFLKSTAAYSVATCFLASGTVLAEWPKQAFADKSKDDVIKQLYGNSATQESKQITIKAPDIAENGAVVPVTIKTSLPNVESVSILVDENPNPLAAQFHITPGNNADVGTRIKMGKKSHVTAIVKSNGKLYRSSKFVKVTRGGCGGG